MHLGACVQPASSGREILSMPRELDLSITHFLSLAMTAIDDGNEQSLAVKAATYLPICGECQIVTVRPHRVLRQRPIHRVP